MRNETSNFTTLTDLPRALRAYGVQSSYQRCWRAVVAGDIPAQRVGNKWIIDDSDLPRAARFFKNTSQAV